MNRFNARNIPRIARVCHEANRAYCVSIGDESQPAWEDAPEWQRKSAIEGVRAHLKSGLTLTPEQSHQEWMHHKIMDGWTYGPEKDELKKTHPCMIPYQELSADQRAKDYIFAGIVHALAADPWIKT